MKSKKLKQVRPLMEREFGPALTETAMQKSWAQYEALCASNADESKAVRAQTRDNLYPCIALYRGLQESGVDRASALRFLDRSWSELAEAQAASIRALLKLPGLYKKMPAIFRRVTLRQFGEAAGFRATFYPTGPDRCKFDMTQCLYCDLCRKNGCPELVPCFCHTDDVTDGNMHPNIRWNRTKTMGEGGDVCDFDLIVEKKK